MAASANLSTATDVRCILVAGSTGAQGAAVIDALLSHPMFISDPSLHILALTRSPSSPKAQSLTALSSRVTLHKGDLTNSPAIFASIPKNGPVQAVFSVQVDEYGSPSKIAQGEVQGRSLIDAAVAAQVPVFVQSSGDRGGREKSDIDPTPVPQFITKFVVEGHLRRRVAEVAAIATIARVDSESEAKNVNAPYEMSYTILRPTSFMENIGPDLHGKGFSAMWSCMGPSKPLQLISTKDIGHFAARALLEPQHRDFHNAAISLAGDELTFAQASEIFKRARGQGKKGLPKAPALIGTLVKWNTPEIKAMFGWFEREGFAADVQECRRVWSGLRDFEGWLQETDVFGK